MSTIINTQQLKKSFPTPTGPYEAVKDVSLEIFEKEIFGFLGPNGAGKTTTLRMLTTLLPIDSGEAIVTGYNVKQQPEEVRRRIGYVSQQGGADPDATGRENLLLQGELYGMSRADTKQSANKLINNFELGGCIDRFVKTYSGGQRRRLDLALGMIHHPKLLFLDEPSTGLDPQNRANLWEQIKSLQTEGVAIFLTSHYLDEVDFLADRLAIMDNGAIITVGSPHALKKQIAGDIISLEVASQQKDQAYQLLQGQPFVKEINYLAPRLRIAVEQGGHDLPHVLRLLDQAHITLENINLSVPTLDDVFLKLTGRGLRGEDKNR
jgi:ABC-2 type transport system ATP-binding protein